VRTDERGRIKGRMAAQPSLPNNVPHANLRASSPERYSHAILCSWIRWGTQRDHHGTVVSFSAQHSTLLDIHDSLAVQGPLSTASPGFGEHSSGRSSTAAVRSS
jgi:hypothetical protein